MYVKTISDEEFDRLMEFGVDNHNAMLLRWHRCWDVIGRPTCDPKEYIPNKTERCLEEVAWYLNKFLHAAAESVLSQVERDICDGGWCNGQRGFS